MRRIEGKRMVGEREVTGGKVSRVVLGGDPEHVAGGLKFGDGCGQDTKELGPNWLVCPRGKWSSREEGGGGVRDETEWGIESRGKEEGANKGKELHWLLRLAVEEGDTPSKVEGDTKSGEVHTGSSRVLDASITEEKRSVRGGIGEGKVIRGPGKGGEEVCPDESSTTASRERDAMVVWHEGEAVEGVEEGARKKVV
jgi:hypothetical protein